MALSSQDRERFLRFATTLSDLARRIVQARPAGAVEVSLKADGSYVTAADRDIEAAWREAIHKEFPGHGLIGEEYPAEGGGSPWQWVLDPIDGTDNFVHGIMTFGTLVSLRHEGQAVVGVADHPALDVRFRAAEGLGAWRNGTAIRITDSPEASAPIIAATAPENFAKAGSGNIFTMLCAGFPNLRIYRDCFAHGCVFQGSAAAMVDWHARLWDVSAAEAITRAAGGAYVRLGGAPDRYQVVFGRPGMVSRIVAAVTART